MTGKDIWRAGNAASGCRAFVLPDGRAYEIDLLDLDEYPADICEEAALMAYNRGGGTLPVSDYDLENARQKITGEVREITRLRTCIAEIEAEHARISDHLDTHHCYFEALHARAEQDLNADSPAHADFAQYVWQMTHPKPGERGPNG